MKTLPQKILVIPLRFIGDTVLTLPLIEQIKLTFPSAEIDVLASKTTAPLLETCPFIHQVLIEKKSIPDKWTQFTEGRYDLAFILRKSVSTALLCKLSGITTLIGYDKQRWFAPLHYKRWGLFLDHPVRYPSLKTQTHQAKSHLSLLLPALQKWKNLLSLDSILESDASAFANPIDLTLWTTPEDTLAIESLLALHQIPRQSKLAGLHLVSASHGKFFAVEKFIEPIQALHQEGYTLITTGLESDIPIYQKLAELSGVPLVNWAGLTSLRETAALFKKLSLLITVDSSPIHLASATHVPKVLGVFGPTNEKQWGIENPRIQFQPVFLDLPCRPCYAKICEHNSCRVDLTGADILAGLKTLLNSPQRTPV